MVSHASLFLFCITWTVIGAENSVLAQCGRWHNDLGTPAGVYRHVFDLASCDIDGSGPRPTELIVAGAFQNAGGVPAQGLAAYDGSGWRTIGTNPNSTFTAVTSWDADGAGPLPRRLVACGSPDSSTASRAAVFDQNAWTPLDPTVGGFGEVIAWDTDGPGPAPELLVGAGGIVNGSGQSLGVAAWNGSTWVALGTGVRPSRLCTWDPDGPGPLHDHLVGCWGALPPGQASGVGVWNGSSWSVLGSMPVGDCQGVASWDQDGPGPTLPVLAAIVNDTALARNEVQVWDGQQWQTSGFGHDSVSDLASFDPDGTGPLNPDLYAGGEFETFGPSGNDVVHHITRWDNTAWRPLGGGIPEFFPFDSFVTTMTVWDKDGDGPQPAQLAIAGEFDVVDDTASGQRIGVDRIALWDGVAWSALNFSGLAGAGGGESPRVADLAPWDPDGTGPLAERLVVAGNFASAGGYTCPGIATWDGQGWDPVGASTQGSFNSVLAWPQTFPLSGTYLVAGGSSTTGARYWNGTNWYAMGGGSTVVVDLVLFKNSTSPFVPPQVVACGAFGDPLNPYKVGVWNSQAWQPLGDMPLEPDLGRVAALLPWDPDAAGPLRQILIAAGEFSIIHRVNASNIAKWDGSQWQPIPGTDGPVGALATWDPDASGPLPPALLAGGGFAHAGGHTVNSIAKWDGTSWTAFGGGITAPGPIRPFVSAVTTFDADADEPGSAQPVVAFSVNDASGRVARWDGSTWIEIAGVTDRPIACMKSWTPPGTPASVAQIIVGGRFINADSLPASYVAAWRVEPTCSPCDPIDFNSDTLFPDTLDIADFLTVFAGGVCAGQLPTDPPCNADIDFNNDTLFPDTDDITTLLRVFAGGQCV